MEMIIFLGGFVLGGLIAWIWTEIRLAPELNEISESGERND